MEENENEIEKIGLFELEESTKICFRWVFKFLALCGIPFPFFCWILFNLRCGAKFWFFLCCRFLGNGAMEIGASKF
jgi:hypothetical protein